MIAGLPWQTWLLAVVAVVPGLLIALRFRSVHRDDAP